MISFGEAMWRIDIGKGWATPRTVFDDAAWQAVYAKCESPIERLMCIGIHNFLGYDAVATEFAGRSSIPSDRRAGALVFGQQPLDRYRVDFLIVGFIRSEPPKLLVVECDGRSVPDPLADHERDWNLSLRGFETVRFTGHEITRDLRRQINRIPRALGERYAYEIAAELGRVDMPEVVDQLEAKATAQIVDDEFADGFRNWGDTI